MPLRFLLWFTVGFIGYATVAVGQQAIVYQRPVATIESLSNAVPTPLMRLSPDRQWAVFLGRPGFPGIDEISKPELRLAGVRIDPSLYCNSRQTLYNSLEFRLVASNGTVPIIGLPSVLRFTGFSFSPQGKYAAFVQHTSTSLELWVVDLQSKQAKKLTNKPIHDILIGYEWLSDESGLLFSTVAQKAGAVPQAPAVPGGPIVVENLGKKAPSRTYQDLLKNTYDESLFTFYMSCKVWKHLLAKGYDEQVLPQALYDRVAPSPDAAHLLVQEIRKPYSYLVPYNRFPKSVYITDLTGKKVADVVQTPLLDDIPTAFNAVEKGPRGMYWRADRPSSLYYFVTLDSGNPKLDVEQRDALYVWDAPWKTPARQIATTPLRATSVLWCNDTVAFVNENWWANRKTRTYMIDPNGKRPQRILFDRSSEDRYADPGTPLMMPNKAGFSVVYLSPKGEVWLNGAGASQEGDYPFLDKLHLNSGKSQRMWRCEKGYYEYLISFLDPEKGTYITSRESKTEQPNMYLRTIGSKRLTPFTKYPNPYPSLAGATKQVLQFKRADSVDLSADLYVPAGYTKAQGPLPTLIWAYPREYKSSGTASQVRGSQHTFVRISWASPLYWVTRGYAVMDNASMPIVGEGNKEPNDTFLPQLIENARAIIRYGASMGVVDSLRVAVGGHSYGAFMTANLLAHSELFKAGIARSGAYNRTLTPFGFQSEERTYWEVPDVYHSMSPYAFAHRVKTPLLLIHGEADNNPGTFPLQSERLYNAIKGHGGTTRYVVLPSESHSYAAEESILHMLWEMDRWLEQYVKAQP